jgi:hypothetical protein
MFWVFWVIVALTGAVTLFVFVAGFADGSVSSFNFGIWAVLLAVVIGAVGGSLWLKASGRRGLAMMLVRAIPAVFGAVFLLAEVLSGARWN